MAKEPDNPGRNNAVIKRSHKNENRFGKINNRIFFISKKKLS